MFTPTNYSEDHISFMDPCYPSLLSPLSYFDIDGYYNNIYYDNYCHDESVLMSLSGGGNTIAESSNNNNEPIVSASSKMDVAYQGDTINGIVEQENNNNNGSTRKGQISCKKRSSKGDRHSKIPTAKGLRDRRMRLSLDVAKQFFTLQDMLSYDKPSQTVKWLLLQAKSVIEELKKGKQISPGSTNYDGVVKGSSPNSELGEEVVENNTIHDNIMIAKEMAPLGKEKGKQTMKKKSFNHEAKEMRRRARERAKQRTKNKKASSVMSDPRRSDLLNYKAEQQVETNPEDYEVVNANWSLPMSQNYHHQEDQTYQMKSVPEFQLHGGSWEPYNYAQFWGS